MIIREEEEALIRKAEKRFKLDSRIPKAYAGLTTQDGMAMALITKVELLKRRKNWK